MSKRKLAGIVVRLLIVLPTVFFGAVVAITGLQCSRTANESDASTVRSRRSSENEAARVAPPNAIGLYAVPLRCQLVSRLGCGSEAKPIMKRIQDNSDVAGLWLNHSGTALAVHWKGQVNSDQRVNIITSAFGDSSGIKQLDDEERDALFKDFLSGTGWYSLNSIDELSTEEADTVATAWVKRITAIIPLPERARDSLHCALAEGMRRKFVHK